METIRPPSEPLLSAAERLIVALDVPTPQRAIEWVVRLGVQVRWFKIGLQLFCAAGPRLVEEIRGRGHKLFLDLKFHDIPNTVAQAIRSVAPLGVEMINVHASGGRAMLEAAAHAAAEFHPAPRVLGVTALTSHSDAELGEMGIADSAAEWTLRLGVLARAAGLGGLVCSGREIAPLRRVIGASMWLVVPGIRPEGTEAGDQKRVATPSEAMAAGADALVIGRPLLEAADPNRAVEDAIRQMASGLDRRRP